jgi:hypothetical protein
MMERVNWIIVARHALHDENGLLHICGVMDTLTGQVPGRVPPFAICYGIEGLPLSTILFTLVAESPSGEKFQLVNEKQILLDERGASEGFVNMDGVTFPSLGKFVFEIRVGDTIAKTPLKLIAPPSVS